MAKLLKLAEKVEAFGKQCDVYIFHCPGCGYSHPFHVPHWNWNGSLDKPTFTPSLIVNRGMPNVCHLFLTDGVIQFLDDCYHALKGQKVPCPDYEESK